MIRGKIIKTSAKMGYYIQLDKNNQICDIFRFDRNYPKEERIRERIRGYVFDMYKGQPLYTAWNSLVECLTSKEYAI
jgi:hypothetical protein